MTRLAILSGQPLSQARRVLEGPLGITAVPTGEANLATSTGLAGSVVASATPHTKGAWVQVSSGLSSDAFGFLVAVNADIFVNNTNTSTLLDIGVGDPGGETVIVANLNLGMAVQSRAWKIPVFVPAGSKVSLRSQSAVISQTSSIILSPIGRSASAYRPSTSLVTMGADTATSRGVTIPTTGTANTKGAWAQITTATTEPFRALILGISGNADGAMNIGTGLLDIGVGGSGSEQTVISNVLFAADSGEAIYSFDHGPWTVSIPAGTRLAIRAQVSTNANSLDAILYGIR